MITFEPRVEMQIRIISETEKPPVGWIRRPRPCWPEFAIKMTWFSEMAFQANGREGLVYVWVRKDENLDYERPHRRLRFCKTYRGRVRKNLEQASLFA